MCTKKGRSGKVSLAKAGGAVYNIAERWDVQQVHPVIPIDFKEEFLMAFCSNCGSQLPENAKACPNCGTFVTDAKAGQSEQAAQNGQPQKPQTDFTAQFTQADIEENKVMAVFAYLGILLLIPLLVSPAKDSPFVRFHVNQGLLLFIAAMISSLLSIICIGLVLEIVCFVFMIMGIIHVINGQAVELPLIGKYRLIK